MELAKDLENVAKQAETAVHRVLAHSYLVYFLFFMIGVALDLIFQLQIMNNSWISPLGLLFLVLASLLILWAQRTTRDLKKDNISRETFCKGPYCYTRSPTHWGLFLLVLGFGLMANAFFVVLFTVLAFLTTKFSFLRKEEDILAKKYGTPYLEYKKFVKF